MIEPKRIQLRRTKGWKKPEGAVVVARNTEWGNPFRVGYPGVPDRAAAVGLFEAAMFLRSHKTFSASFRAFVSDECGGIPEIETVIAHLRGKDLACWCPPDQPCHADVLLRLANGFELMPKGGEE